MGPRTPDHIQLHAEAHNALAMALHYLRQHIHNLPGASRKTVQALASLNLLKVGAAHGCAANDSGRA